jgi:hypothetical protein
MSDREYKISTGMREKLDTELCVHVKQETPESKPGFFRAVIGYGDMTAESLEGLKAVWKDFQAQIKKAVGQDPENIVGSYDDLMCVQVLNRQLAGTLCEMGFDYAKANGIATPKADALRGSG